MHYKLFLTAREKAKLRNALANNMWTDIKLSKSELSKIIQSGGFLGRFLGKLPDLVMEVVVPLAKNVSPPLTSAITSEIDDTMRGCMCL